MRIRYINISYSCLEGGLDCIEDGIWEMGLGERLVVGWILYLLVSLVGGLQKILGVDVLQDYTLQGTAVHILIWDIGIGVFGSPYFNGVDIRVEHMLESMIEDLPQMIILLIRSIQVACVVRTWRDHVLRGDYYMSQRWIWDTGIIHRLI